MVPFHGSPGVGPFSTKSEAQAAQSNCVTAELSHQLTLGFIYLTYSATLLSIFG